MDWGAVLQAGAAIADKAIPYVVDNHWKHREVGMQYDFAKNQIQWRVEDAKKAGLHPLYALGASPYYPNAHLVGGQASGGLGFTEAFNSVANSKYEKELQRQTLEMNQLKIDGQKMANQIAYLESVKPVRPMGQAPLTSVNISQPVQSSTPLKTQPRNVLESIIGNDGLYRLGADINGALQDMVSEGFNAESARHLLLTETPLGVREYQLVADWLNSKRKSKDDPFYMVFKDDFYGPVILDSRKFDYYYGVHGKRRSLRSKFDDWYDKGKSKFDDWYDKGKSKFNSKIADYERLVYRKRYGRYMPYGE